MTMFPTARYAPRLWFRRGLVLPVALGAIAAAAAIALVTYLLWPTWGARTANGPERLPISIGGTLFNIPTAAIRMKIQRHSGPQERVDLVFAFPSLEPPEAARRVTADQVDAPQPPIDRLFLSIAAHHDTLAPDMRVRTIYPRYLQTEATSDQDGLSLRAFRENTPYAGEDFVQATAPRIEARCSRDGVTPGMCLSDRRVDAADLTFRFPRSWLSQWREVAAAMDRATAQLRGPH